MPEGWKQWHFWQYTESGKVAGIDGLPPCPSFAHGVHNLRLLKAVVDSAAHGGREVKVG